MQMFDVIYHVVRRSHIAWVAGQHVDDAKGVGEGQRWYD